MDYLLQENMRLAFTETDQFILKYRAAVKVGLSREQLAAYLGMIPDSLRRKRLKILDKTGLDLPQLEMSGDTSIPVALLEEFEEMIEYLERKQVPDRINEYNANMRFVITSAQNATPVNVDFFNCLKNYCDINDAELLVIPLRYRNPTSMWTERNEVDEWWAPEVTPYMQSYSRKLSKSLEYMGHIKIQPTAISPLTGFESYTGLASGIFGHPKVELKAIATPSARLPKILTTTGSVTHLNFTDSKAGHKGAFHHSFAAVVVEVDSNGHHHIRHVHWNSKKKGFYDLDKFYTKSSVTDGHRALGLVTGDTHAEFIDKTVERATYIGDNSLMGRLRPQHLVWHDVEDFYRRNHHHVGDDVIAYGKHHFGRNNVEEGLQITADLIDRYSNEETVNVIVKSNHDEAFERWLKEANPKNDPENSRFYYYMKYHQMKSVRMTPTGFESFDPFVFWCLNPDQQKGLKNSQTIFLERDESFELSEVDMGFHGDQGPNGARGSIIAFSKIGPKVIIGHSHSPGIREGAYQVGVSAMLDLEYRKGPSSWMHTHCLVYPDGSRTLINIIDGEYTTME